MAQPTSVPGHPSGIHGPRRPTHRPVAFSHTENIAKLFACHAPIMVSGCRPYPFASRDKLYPGSTPTLLAEPRRVRPGSLTEDNPWPHVCFPTWESPDPLSPARALCVNGSEADKIPYRIPSAARGRDEWCEAGSERPTTRSRRATVLASTGPHLGRPTQEAHHALLAPCRAPFASPIQGRIQYASWLRRPMEAQPAALRFPR